MPKCSECGFLTLRNSETGQLIEADGAYRKYGKPIYGDEDHIENYPICIIRLYDLETEEEDLANEQILLHLTKGSNAGEWPEYILQVINKERQCSAFREWRQGFTPKEHVEMVDREWLLKHQEEQLREDRKWLNNQQIKLVVIAGIFTILGALIVALISLIN